MVSIIIGNYWSFRGCLLLQEVLAQDNTGVILKAGDIMDLTMASNHSRKK